MPGLAMTEKIVIARRSLRRRGNLTIMSFKDIQIRISEFVNDKSATTADYLAIFKELELLDKLEGYITRAESRGYLPHYFRKIRVAFLSSYIIQSLPEVFRARAIFHNLSAEVYNAPYAQISQEILNSESGLYKFAPNVIYILAEQKDFLSDKHLGELVGVLREKMGARIVLVVADNNVAPRQSSGIKDFSVGTKDFYSSSLSRSHYYFDFNAFLAKIGREEHWYTKYKDLGDMRLAPQAFPALSEELLAYAVAAAGNTKKCLVLDLDNTLWDGVVGEDGMTGIKPNKKLQEYILDLYKRGVILAINSKNNFEDAMEAIERHPEMVLRKNHFAAWRINWNMKDGNIAELADELSLGTDSFVFLDDDALNMRLIRTNKPEVAVMHSESIYDYAGFHSFGVTAEDARRGEMYAEERQRKEHKAKFKSPEEFLRDLKMEVTIERVNEESIPRISQLTQKTNQFNLTTRRYSESEVRDLLAKNWRIWTIKAKDVFGDYGVIGAAMGYTEGEDWKIDNFLLSCRVLGRGIENVFLAHIFDEAKKAGARTVGAEFISTKKNKPAENFLPQSGFRLIKVEAKKKSYRFDLKKPYIKPTYLRVLTK